jgi:hypothetical protein
VSIGSTFYTYIETAKWHGIVSGYGDNTFHPGDPALRGQLSKMLFVALNQAADQRSGIGDRSHRNLIPGPRSPIPGP